jgi:hypothetical protein
MKERGRDRGWANPLLHAPAIIAILKGTMTLYTLYTKFVWKYNCDLFLKYFYFKIY